MIEDADLQAKSDQMNAVDFVEPITFRVESVSYFPKKEQPVHIHMEGYKGRPYKPCKGMLRGLSQTNCWGKDEQQWAGKLITLYCDPTVKWAGKETGGIRISAVSGIKEPHTFALALNKSQRVLHTFTPLSDATATKKQFVLTHCIQDLESCESNADIDAILKSVKSEFGNDCLMQMKDAATEARARVANSDITAEQTSIAEAEKSLPEGKRLNPETGEVEDVPGLDDKPY